MMPNAGTNPIFVSIEAVDLAAASAMVESLRGRVGGIKLGLEFFLSLGPDGYRAIASLWDTPLFLDLKLHDIPNTVAKAVSALLPLRPAFLTLHAAGGAAMMNAAAKAALAGGVNRPKLLGVTVLTSLDTDDLSAVGQDSDTSAQVLRLARLAKESGLDGVICSPQEVALLRRELGPDFILMVPGIRPVWADVNDQKRVMTPAEAMQAGASYLVIGRPITAAPDPAAAAARIAEELQP